jgi:hypothetical protein
MNCTPFNCEEDLNFLEKKGIYITNDLISCDIILTARLHRLTPFRFIFGYSKKYLAWTNEPRYDTTFKNRDKGFLWIPDAHIMNVYTGDIFTSNSSLPIFEQCYRQYWVKANQLQPLDKDFKFQNRKVVAIMGYKGDQKRLSLKKQGRELDLSYLRTQIALAGYKMGKVDIYGYYWPDNISLEVSRGEGYYDSYRNRKAEILKKYNFNLCFENTNFDYYCTEKIWDSIQYGCLPIYYSEGNKIYENFPKNSFIDYSEFENPAELFNFIGNMDIEEFRTRMNLCIEVFNRIQEKLKCSNLYEDLLMRIVEKFQKIMSEY